MASRPTPAEQAVKAMTAKDPNKAIAALSPAAYAAAYAIQQFIIVNQAQGYDPGIASNPGGADAAKVYLAQGQWALLQQHQSDFGNGTNEFDTQESQGQNQGPITYESAGVDLSGVPKDAAKIANNLQADQPVLQQLKQNAELFSAAAIVRIKAENPGVSQSQLASTRPLFSQALAFQANQTSLDPSGNALVPGLGAPGAGLTESSKTVSKNGSYYWNLGIPLTGKHPVPNDFSLDGRTSTNPNMFQATPEQVANALTRSAESGDNGGPVWTYIKSVTNKDMWSIPIGTGFAQNRARLQNLILGQLMSYQGFIPAAKPTGTWGTGAGKYYASVAPMFSGGPSLLEPIVAPNGSIGTVKTPKAPAVITALQLANLQQGWAIQSATVAQSNAELSAFNSTITSVWDIGGFPKQIQDQMNAFTTALYQQAAVSKTVIPQSEVLTQFKAFGGPGANNLYDQIFPGLRAANTTTPGHPGVRMTEADYTKNWTLIANVAQQFLPKGFFTRATYGNMVKNGVSVNEMQDRVVKAYNTVAGDPRVLNQFSTYFGNNHAVTLKALAAHMLDPKNAQGLVMQQSAAASLGAFGAEAGLTGLSQGTGLGLAMAMGNMSKSNAIDASTGTGNAVTMAQQRADILAAARDQNLTQKQFGQAGNIASNTTSEAALLTANMPGLAGGAGTTVQAQESVQRAEQSRLSRFQGGGGYEDTSKGVVGAGSAKQ